MVEFLEIADLQAFYGDFQALHGLSLSLKQGDVLALIGANGAGKSTLLKSIVGLVSGKGSVRWKGGELLGQRSHTIVAQGIALVPEGRRLFPSLSVEENLVLGGQVGRPGPWGLKALYDRSRFGAASTRTCARRCRSASPRTAGPFAA